VALPRPCPVYFGNVNKWPLSLPGGFLAVIIGVALAVALGLIPSFAAWVLLQIETTLRVAGASLYTMWDKFGPDLYIKGVAALSQGFIATAMILSAAVVFMIERNFLKAAYRMFAGSASSCRSVPAGIPGRFLDFRLRQKLRRTRRSRRRQEAMAGRRNDGQRVSEP
jgi:hypothetical protein